VGYDAARVAAWAAAIDVLDEKGSAKEIHVAELDGNPVGWMSIVAGDADAWVLDDLWVDPESMGRGAGTLLFHRALELVRERGGARLELEAEPNAVTFYERLGATYVRDSPPSEWGRTLPVYGIELRASPVSRGADPRGTSLGSRT